MHHLQTDPHKPNHKTTNRQQISLNPIRFSHGKASFRETHAIQPVRKSRTLTFNLKQIIIIIVFIYLLNSESRV